MRKPEKYFFIFALAAILCLLGTPTSSFVHAQTATKSVSVKSASGKSTSKRHAAKKKVKIKQAMNQTNASILSPGAWGANGIALDVTDAGAQVEYDCASGEITEKLNLDSDGNFSVNGTHTPRAPGPIRVGFEPKPEAARYEGKISGDAMTLKVILTASGTTVGEYALKRGVTPRMHRCY